MAEKQDEKKVTPRSQDFSAWYNEIVLRAELADYSPVRGCIVFRPDGFAIWEALRDELDRRIKKTGARNAYFPLFIPQSFLEKEAKHVEGFAPEVALVTRAGGKELEEPLVIRPTSETIINHMFSQWIRSHRDLPMMLNQWCNVVRWEMRTRLFLRTAEFLWQEGHTAHATQKEAEDEAMTILMHAYRKFAEEWMAMPVLTGPKSEGQKFPGAVYTLCIEAMMQDGKALQAGTSHFLGQNFAKAFDVTFQNQEGKREFAWATSWGVSTRLVGGLIMTHSDDNGLVVPPRLAATHAVICPMGRNGAERGPCIAAAEKLAAELNAKPRNEFFGFEPIAARVDRDFDKSPGFRFAEHELRGVPVRVEIGPKDIEKQACVLARRDRPGREGKEIGVPLAGAADRIDALLRDIQTGLFDKAKSFRDANTRPVDTYEQFKAEIEKPGFLLAHWDGTRETENKIQEETKATIRCIPLAGQGPAPEPGKCVKTGRPSSSRDP
jgi:prolyl-tRNA synthetase